MTRISFTKMHGAGNDFVVIDNRDGTLRLSPEQIRHIADRHFGVGCDQVIVMEASTKADVRMRIYNADGGEVASCGNATRCIAWRLTQETDKENVTIETQAGVLTGTTFPGDENPTVDMGKPRLEWNDIPLAQPMDTEQLDIHQDGLEHPVAVSMGNPHMIFFVGNVDAVRLDQTGPLLEHHPLFPERANVSVAQIVNPTHIRARVWERGAGLTLACGTAACAIVVAASRKGLVDRDQIIYVDLPGGTLQIRWIEDVADSKGHVFLTGPVVVSFTGEIAL